MDGGTANTSTDVAIIGGGAAGFFAAITCAEANPARRVIILERGTEVLAKVRVSGGGRCNVTHACFDPAKLVRSYPRGDKELRGPFHAWQPADTVKWFAARGVELKTEADGRMFPVTDDSRTIVECLTRAAREAGVTVRTRTGVNAARAVDGGFTLAPADGGELRCAKLLIAAGGLKPGPLHDTIAAFGHTIEPLAPSLFTFHVRDARLEGLAGLSVESAEASIPAANFTQRGPVLVTHWGLSGPAILKLSAWGARWLQSAGYQFECRVNWLDGANAERTANDLRALKVEHARKKVTGQPAFNLPRRLWEKLAGAAGVGDALTWSHLSAPQMRALTEQLTAATFAVSGKSMNKEEFVTCGGVRLREINFKTMASRLVPGLHFAGEVLDIDAVTGGFNFQAAWTGGMLAGRALAEG